MSYRGDMGSEPRGPPTWVCPLCRRAKDEAKLLNCYHMVCLECLKKHVLQYCRNGLFPCPRCKVLIPLPVWGGLDAFDTIRPTVRPR